MPPLDCWLNRAEAYGNRGQWPKAKQCLRIAANCSPSLKVRLAIAAAFAALS